jgi:hypothetical protein
MSNDTRFLQLVDALYESALDRNSWPSFLDLVRQELGGSAACLLYHDAADHRGGVEEAVGLDPAALLAYSQHYAPLDPWALALGTRRLLKPSLVCIGESIVASSCLRTTEFYNDYGLRYGVVRNAFALRFNEAASAGFVLTVLRPERAEPFGSAAVELLGEPPALRLQR